MNNQLTNMWQNFCGKETIDTNTFGKSSGHSGSYSTNYQQAGRELLTADEVRMLDNEKAILFIRGEKPIIDLKYDILKHPNIKYTTDGEGKGYEHGVVDKATGTIDLLTIEELNEWKDTEEMKEVNDTNYTLLSEEDIKNYFIREEYENERRKNVEENKKD